MEIHSSSLFKESVKYGTHLGSNKDLSVKWEGSRKRCHVLHSSTCLELNIRKLKLKFWFIIIYFFYLKPKCLQSSKKRTLALPLQYFKIGWYVQFHRYLQNLYHSTFPYQLYKWLGLTRYFEKSSIIKLYKFYTLPNWEKVNRLV